MNKTFSALLILFFLGLSSEAQKLEAEYINNWTSFYPNKALANGMNEAIFIGADRSQKTIEDWISYNKNVLQETQDGLAAGSGNRINQRLLRVQAQSEIDLWEKQSPQTNSSIVYTNLIFSQLKSVNGTTFITSNERKNLLEQKLAMAQKLCEAGINQLTSSSKSELERSLNQLNRALELVDSNTLKNQSAIESMNVFSKHLEKLLLNATQSDDLLGRDEYARRLALYTDRKLTPEELTKMAREEIERVKVLMVKVAKKHLSATYPSEPVPTSEKQILDKALDDMQKDAPKSGAEYLEFWQELSANAITFLEEKQIATLPEYQTLRILPAPESAGPAARIGWVDSAPPFAPNPLTTLYLPSIPDTLPQQEQDDFWASFNKPFNRIIVIHELFPGHYMQLKISRETPHKIRLLFPYGTYIEGWATFCERVALDNGWEENNHLSMLAHLRKRLENANRAYTSVQVHCNEWTKNQVMDFSVNTSLVAPQFAKSLWGRIMRSPLQLTSYFLGSAQFSSLLSTEMERLGDDFDLRYFMDTIMKAGPIPIDEFEKIFADATGR